MALSEKNAKVKMTKKRVRLIRVISAPSGLQVGLLQDLNAQIQTNAAKRTLRLMAQRTILFVKALLAKNVQA